MPVAAFVPVPPAPVIDSEKLARLADFEEKIAAQRAKVETANNPIVKKNLQTALDKLVTQRDTLMSPSQ